MGHRKKRGKLVKCGKLVKRGKPGVASAPDDQANHMIGKKKMYLSEIHEPYCLTVLPKAQGGFVHFHKAARGIGVGIV